MAQPWYRQGTITLTEDSAIVTGAMTGWGNPAYLREGDALYRKDAGQMILVDEIKTARGNPEALDTELELVNPWTGSTLADIEYAIMPMALIRSSVASLAYDISTFTQSVTVFINGAGPPSDEDGQNGWGYVDTVALKFHLKIDGEWNEGTSMVGPAGPQGPTYAATSTTSVAIGTGSKTLTVQAGRAYTVGARIRTTSAANPTTHYMEGPITAYNFETGELSFTSDKFAGSGSRADWNINIAGDVGAKGDPGASFAAASTTSLEIGTGTKAFTVAAGLAYVPGQRARASSAANLANSMEGPVASYAGTTLTLTVDRTSGSGTLADWSIGLMGAVGATGRGYGATSTTSRNLGTGTMSFATQENLAYVAGSRVRFASAANPTTHYMEGVIDTYSGTAITVLFDLFQGSGARADWVISLAGEVGSTGAAATIEVGAVTTVDPGDPAQVGNSGTSAAAVLTFAIPRGAQGIPGATGPNTGLDYQWDSGSTDSDPGDGDLRVNSADWGLASFIFISKTGRNGEELGSVIETLCGANNAHRAHVRIFTIADPGVYFQGDVTSAPVDGGNYWKLPISNLAVSPAQPTAGDVLSVTILRSGDGVSADVQSIVHAYFGGL